MTPQRNTGAGAEAELPEYAGHYRLESCLGSGGMGVVHLARSTSGLKLAVKVVHAEFARDPEFRGRFRQEVAAARRVSGAFTAPVVDADPEAERPWMATLFIPGPTLAEQVKRNGPMAPAQVRRLMAGLAEALRDIHRVGVVHRDLKPSNVLLAEDGPKVIDFGISRPKDSELRTETGKLIGTPPFMAPEQFRRPREVGPAADIFALGSVLVHAATGRGPFDSDSPYLVAYQVVHDEPDLTGMPEDLAPLVQRCLAKEPADRPTPDELMRALRSAAASYDTQAFIPAQRTQDVPPPRPGDGHEGPEAADPSRDGQEGAEPADPSGDGREGAGPKHPTGAAEGERARASVRRLRKRAALVAGAVGLLVAGGVGVWAGVDGTVSVGASPRTTPAAFDAWAVKPVTGRAAALPQCTYGSSSGSSSTISSGGPSAVSSGGSSARGDSGLLFCAQSGSVVALAPSDGAVRWRRTVAGAGLQAPVLSGGLVYVPTADGRHLKAFDPSSGRPRAGLDLPAQSGWRFVGGTLVVARADGTVTGVDSVSGRTRWSRRIAGYSLPSLTSFPGDALAYVTSSSADGAHTRITAVDPETGAVRRQATLRGYLQPVGAHDGSVFLLDLDRVYGETEAVVRYTGRTGAVRRVALPARMPSAQAVVRGGVVHLLGAGGTLRAVDMGAGRQVWQLETAVSQGSAPVCDGRYVYVVAADGRLLAVDARTGRLAGQTRPRLGGRPGALAAPVLAGGHVYAGAPDGTVFAVDGQDPSGW
jgi:serine/threonine protein kinase/outer membrane protein assembly factor BamB